MPTWNPQQLLAIQTKHKNILVSASAGAGKTTVLIARLVDLVIKDRIGIEHILAMTFTEAAANEMKKRLAAELHKLLQEVSDEAERQYIAEQLSAVSTAHISTIHSFCLSILQEFYYIIGLSAKRISTIMDNGTTTQAVEQAMQEVFAKQYALGDDAFYELTSMFSARAESDDALRSAIASLATMANSQSDPDAWLRHNKDIYRAYSSIRELPQEIQASFFDDLRVKQEMYANALNELKELYQLQYQEEVKKADLVFKKWAALPPLEEALQQSDYSSYRDAFIAICHIVPPPSPDKEDKNYARLRKKIIALEDEMLANLFEEHTLLKDLEQLSRPIGKLVEMCCDYRAIFARIKAEKECIDFDDMEHFALAILQANNHQVAKHYQALFDEIMVDEFQDSNDVQNELVKLICRDNNVFRVGDIKQSIYGFRHAKPQLMRGLIENKGPKDEIIYLSNNYRSKKMIVDFNNTLFKELMNLDGFDGSYRKEDDVETGIPAQLEDNYPILFHALDAAAIKEEADIIISKNELKASYIAHQIIEIREKEHRKWKDFVVLVRANARKQDMKQIFDELNIPCFIDVKSGFYQSNAVQIMLSTLRALINPSDEISFIAAMISPLFQMQIQEIADIKLAKGDDESYYQYMKDYAYPAIPSFDELRAQLYTAGICDMLNQLYNVKDYYANHTTMQERTNLDLLFDNAARFEQDEAKGILAFIKSIDAIKDAQTAEAIPIGSDADVVRVMSIHQSKGLQFPVVFLWSNDKQTPIEFKELFVCDSDLGFGLKYMDIEQRFTRTTINRLAIEHKKDKEELEEEMRILYVATTRAQQQMHVVDCVKSLEDYNQTLSSTVVYQRGGYTSWVLNSSMRENSPLFTIRPVSHMWENIPQDKEEKAFMQIPVYAYDDEVIDIQTPSQLKQAMSMPELSFDTHKGARHGTMLHQLIEQLPNRIWTKEDILAIQNDLGARDVHALLALGRNTIYQTACTYPEVYHELPFMIQEEGNILHGFIDFAAMNEEEIILIDFKSDYVTEEQELLSLYKEQIHAYEKAMHQLFPKKTIRSYLYSLTLHKEILVS